MSKYNNKSTYFRDWSTDKLKEEATKHDKIAGSLGLLMTKEIHNSIGINLELIDRGVNSDTMSK